MKLMNKVMLALIALFSVTGYSFGYTFGVSNKSGKTLVVRVKPRSAEHVIYDVIPKGKRIAANLGGLLCLESIQVAEFDPQEKFQGNGQQRFDRFKGKNLAEIKEMGGRNDNDVYNNVFAPFAGENAFVSARMVMQPSQLYKDTAKAATAIAAGFDDLGCKITEIAMAAQTGGATDVINQVKNLASGDKKAATDSKKDAAKLVSDAKADPAKKPAADQAIANAQTKDKIVSLGALEVAVGSVIIDEKLFEYITTPVASAIAAFDAQKALFDDVTYNKVKGLLSSGKNEDAIAAIENYRKALEASSSKTSIDDEAMIYGCSTCDTNTYVDTKPAKNCSFGIGEIAKASGNIAGISICKDREFIIYESAEEEMIVTPAGPMKTGHKGYVAATDQGA